MTLHEKIAQARLLAERATLGLSYEGIRSRLEECQTPVSTKFYQEEKGVGQLHRNYCDHVQSLLWEVDRLERKQSELVPALAEALAIAVSALERMQEPTGEGSYDALRIIRSNAREAIMEIGKKMGVEG